MKNFLKNQKGVTGADAILAVAIAVLFAGIIVTLAYNIYITTNSLKRSSQALSYITSTFEYVATQYYDDVTKGNIEGYIVALDEGKVSTVDPIPYKAEITVTQYNATEDNGEKLDLVKEITMSITYKLGEKEQKIEMKTAKSREKFENPNRPDLDLLILEENKYKYPIKYVEGQWKIATINDADWYNYDDGIWATVLVTEEQKVIGDIVTKDDGTIYLWIPRFEYNPNPKNEQGYKVNFLYKNTEKKITTKDENGITKLEERDFSKEDNSIPSEFNNVTGVWILRSNLESDPYLYFNNTECEYHLNSKIYEGKLW